MPAAQQASPQPGRIRGIAWVLLQPCSGAGLPSDVDPAYTVLYDLGCCYHCGRYLASLREVHSTIATALDNWLEPLWPLNSDTAAQTPRAGPASLKVQARGAVKLITGILRNEDVPDTDHYRAATPTCSFEQHMGRLVAAMDLCKRSEPVRIKQWAGARR